MSRPQSLTKDQISAWPAWAGVEDLLCLDFNTPKLHSNQFPIHHHSCEMETDCFNTCPADLTNEAGAIPVSLKIEKIKTERVK